MYSLIYIQNKMQYTFTNSELHSSKMSSVVIWLLLHIGGQTCGTVGVRKVLQLCEHLTE